MPALTEKQSSHSPEEALRIRNKAERPLRPFWAVCHALLGGKVSHYPRFLKADGTECQISEDELSNRISAALKDLELDDSENIDFLLTRGRESLDEVKNLTQYEDQKATRNLTVITFLSALSGVLFSRLVESYPLHPLLDDVGMFSIKGTLIISVYLFFFLFIIHAASGALVVFHATRIRFKYPSLTTTSLDNNKELAKSFLFYSSIIQILPERWADSFLNKDLNNGKITTRNKEDIGLLYFKNYIIESYLIASKVADKLRYLQPAQVLLDRSARILFLWLIIVVLTFLFIPQYENKQITTKPNQATSAATSGVDSANRGGAAIHSAPQSASKTGSAQPASSQNDDPSAPAKGSPTESPQAPRDPTAITENPTLPTADDSTVTDGGIPIPSSEINRDQQKKPDAQLGALPSASEQK